MSDAPRWSFRAYHETPEHAALRGESTPPPEPVSVARTQLGQIVRSAGYVLDFTSIREDHREAVVVNDAGDDYRPAAPGEAPTGHVVTWSAGGYQRQRDDADVPVLDVTEHAEGYWVATVPDEVVAAGGDLRVRHNLGGEVTVYAYGADGAPRGYLFATPITRDLTHMEVFEGTTVLHVHRDA